MTKVKRTTKRPETTEDFAAMVEINPHSLDEEWLGQPGKYFHLASRAAEAREAVDRTKLKMDIVQANLDKRVRAEPDEFGLDKITEKAVETAVKSSSEYIQSQEEFLEARKRLAIIEAAVTAMEHRKKALENLVYLHGQQYYSEPALNGSEGEAVEKTVKNSTRKRMAAKAKKENENG